MILELIDCNDPLLKQEMEPFDFSNPPVNPLDLVTDLAETMLANNGIGLSANQCGLPYRVFVMLGHELIPCFNPRIVDMSEETIVLEEGCLSYPDLYVKVKRPRRIKVRYAEPNGNIVTQTFDGMTARVFQHELDHLNGINYQQRANRYHLQQARKKKKPKNNLSVESRNLIRELNT
ncbi:Def N-formylmethionyl-tRNA deformylase [uncultured Caudovirales phage]|uniref:Def N-formylmethionyl-tRNA deformylase n=1 Tax=uncultured Caudovirales phage TaxID=2100421 RepID=A0A6J5M925_9CAUD|nr:Def N-formylmethionyl-tRNA deformylase [uncultured Caudovirales phage]